MPTLLVTGANRGLGLEFASQYSADGWTVIGTAREPDKATELGALDNCATMQLDVADADSVDSFMNALGDRPLDLFISNAGTYGSREVDRGDWRKTLEVNTIAPTMLALRLKPNVMASERKKMAVLTSKMGSMTDNGSGGAIIYRSSKAAVNAAWKSLAIDFEDDGIAVVMLHPGWVQTDMGGPNALIDTKTSVSGMREVIGDLDLNSSGRFLAYDSAEIGW
ncbi:MAG: SDR family oxidoreductase [Sphingomonadaceae bacterium]|nr:SDR family oxidoreductase [Sphingomonadaceae bacterium]